MAARFRVERTRNSTHPARRWHVYDYAAGQIAREPSGRLAYYPTEREARNALPLLATVTAGSS